MSCEIIDATELFDAIRTKKDEYWKAATIITTNMNFENKLKVAEKVLKTKTAKTWFTLKLYEYYGGDDYA